MQSNLTRAITGARRWPAMIAAALLVASVAAACGGDDNEPNPPPRTTPVVEVATFTPVPPEVLATQTAGAEAAAQTATAQPAASPTIPLGTPGESTGSNECEVERREGEISPPDLFLSAGNARQCGMIASFNWYEPIPVDRGAKVEPQQGSLIPDGNITAPAGEPMSLVTDQTTYPIESATVSFYEFQSNIAIPTDSGGNVVGDNYVFVPQTDPAWSGAAEGALLSFTPQLAPGRYIAAIRTDFAADPAVEASIGPIFSAYTFVVTVQ